MEDDTFTTTSLDSSIVFSSLWSNTSKCVLGIVDTLLITDGRPDTYLFTSKSSGEVVKKKRIIPSEIKERFSRISTSSESKPPFAAVLYYADSSYEFITESALDSLLSSLSFTSGDDDDDTSKVIVAIQPYVVTSKSGNTGGTYIIWRNTIRIPPPPLSSSSSGDQKPNITATSKGTIAIIPSSTTTVTRDCDIKFEKSNAREINNTLSEITTNVVTCFFRHVKRMDIACTTFDYHIDSRTNQIYLRWIPSGNTTIRRQHQNNKLKVQSSPSKSKSEEKHKTQLVQNAMSVLHPASSSSGSSTKTSFREKLLGANSNNGSSASMMTSKSSTKKKYYPTPHRCSGDYCDYESCDNSTILIKKLFTTEELQGGLESRLQESMAHSNNNAMASSEFFNTITYKSIALAKTEQRGLYDKNDSTSTNSTTMRFQQKTESQAIKSNWLKKMGQVSGGASHYYKQVKVCPTCYGIYSMLNLARDYRNHNTRDAKTTLPAIKKPRPSSPEVTSSTKVEERDISTKDETIKEDKASLLADLRPRPWEESNAKFLQKEKKVDVGACTVEGHGTLDSYLRGKAKSRVKTYHQDGTLFRKDTTTTNTSHNSIRILVLDPDYDDSRALQSALTSICNSYTVIEHLGNGQKTLMLLQKGQIERFNLIFVSPTLDGNVGGLEFTKLIRQEEIQYGLRNNVLPVKAVVVAYTSDTSPDHMSQYVNASMDGCLSKPLDLKALSQTLVAAGIITKVDGGKNSQRRRTPPHPIKKKTESRDQQHKQVTTNGAVLPLPSVAALATSSSNDSTSRGLFQMDADTVMPYAVLRKGNSVISSSSSNHKFFNLVVLHDFFDTYERMEIFLSPLLARYPGVSALLFNYPGQAFTQWRKDVLLNNTYYVTCVSALLRHVTTSTKEFPADVPFIMLGYGMGGNVGLTYASSYPSPLLRSLVLVNSYVDVDASLSASLHDCMNVFACCPESRPDMNVYFYSRFLFSSSYLSKVSTPMALNVYTAVHNPISNTGRIQIAQGALNHSPIRMDNVNIPVITIASSEDHLIKSHPHVDAIISGLSRATVGVDPVVSSIHKVITKRRGTCVIWIKSGHEVFQEAKKSIENLLEQFITGYHEKYDVPIRENDDNTALVESPIKSDKHHKRRPKTFEDKFINNLVTTLDSNTRANTIVNHAATTHTPNQDERSNWEKFKSSAESAAAKRSAPSNRRRPGTKQKKKTKPLTAPANNNNNTEVKEYMAWRINRNQKKLKRLESCAVTVQRAYRAYMARTLTRRMQQLRCALLIQRTYRGYVARVLFARQKAQDSAARLLQRYWRGRLGRGAYVAEKSRRLAAIAIQRIVRGFLAKRYVTALHASRNAAARVIQALFRRQMANLAAYEKRRANNAATTIQRMYRGHLGRLRASAERSRFLFSKSQSQGIEFGREMLLEHRVHGTRLQTDVALLSKEKLATESAVEVLLDEISEFEEGVRMLEHEMHTLSKVETEATGVLDEEARWTLREQKMRLDKEFGSMLGKIADRKAKLEALETKLRLLDRERQVKDEELRDLEKKLVVLLADQQSEIEAIKSKQDSRSQVLLDVTAGKTDPGVLLARPSNDNASGGNASSSAVTLRQRQEANALVESTETMMKFGFMSMSMTYFSSMNMVKAMRNIGVHQTLLDGAAAASEVVRSQPDLAASLGVNSQSDIGMAAGNTSAVNSFKSALLPGQMPGQQATLQVIGWSVADVGRWLDTLALGQYKAAFCDAAVDGAFLYDLNEDDLKNTLGIEHGLHRKKVLSSIDRLRLAEGLDARNSSNNNHGVGPLASARSSVTSNSAASSPIVMQKRRGRANASISIPNLGNNNGIQEEEAAHVTASFAELQSMVRNGKFKTLKKALSALPDDRPFDKSTITTQNVPNVGTIYDDGTNRLAFHLNKGNDKGNTLLCLAAQNNAEKICELLVKKGANVNHQNAQGQTAAHYAMGYNFFDLGAWLLDPDKGGGRDDLENVNGLTPYDGLG